MGITVRGNYIAPDAKPSAGERRLYLAIESVNEKGLSLAKSEIARIIKEEISKMVISNNQTQHLLNLFYFIAKSCITTNEQSKQALQDCLIILNVELFFFLLI